VRRIVITGGPGNGKTTLARRLASELGLAHIELDSLHHVTDWGSVSEGEFRRDLSAAMDEATEGWVTCGGYVDMSGGLHIARADTLVWMDLPRATVTWRTAKRTIRRAITREELYGNGLTEPMTNFYRWDPEKNVIRWAWVHHRINRVEYPQRIASPEWQHLEVHHLRSQAAVHEFLERVTSPQG
jgi:adenylate kinase family enzyme